MQGFYPQSAHIGSVSTAEHILPYIRILYETEPELYVEYI